MVNFAHVHLLLNHFPIIGTLIGLGLFLLSFFEKSQDLRRAALIIFAFMALLTIPAFESGVVAANIIKTDPAISAAMIQRHEGSAMLALWFILITGFLSLAGLWQSHRDSRPAGWTTAAVLIFALVSVGLAARVGNTGGDIRHPETHLEQGTSLAPNQQITITEGPIGSVLSKFEPTPDKFTLAMVSSKWWWAFMMDLHFIGLALLIGSIGTLDMRLLGFWKQMPVGPLQRLLPWAIAGFGINLVTGMLAFIGMPIYYSYDVAFWLKMGVLMLLGLNVAAFYLTGVFDGVERLGPGQDAPFSAKLMAASSLILWFSVLILGRYIQFAADLAGQ